MIDVTVYTLEDDKKYSLVDSLTYNNNVYVLLCEIDDITNICIRKLVKINNEEYFQRLDVEFDKVYDLFLEKNMKLLEKNN